MSSESINHRVKRVSGSRRSGRGTRRPASRRPASRLGSRRRATVLVFVLALLGILFVMGISFVTLTQFESKAIDSERERSLSGRSADGLFQEMGRVLQEGLGGPLSLSGAGDDRVAFSEMPGVHNTFSPIEPYWVASGLDPPKLVFGGLTDLGAQATGDKEGKHLRKLLGDFDIADGLPTNLENAFPLSAIVNGEPVRLLLADADGDGVVDSIAVDVRDLALFSNSQMSVLAPVLNADSNPAGAVHLAVRILPHGGLVDLNHAHPSLIKKALDLNYLDGVEPLDPQGTIYHRPSQEHVGYAPALEEVGLRRRNFLPSRSLAPSALMGNPFLDPDSSTYGEADMYTILLSPGPSSGLLTYQSVYDDAHRYWPIDPSEPFNSGAPEGLSLWPVRMEPGTSYLEDDTFDEYDQRHLVTTVSHDDLLARGADVVISNGNTPPLVVTRDLLDMMATANMVEWNPYGNECRPGEFPPPGDTAYTDSAWFELSNYPHTLPNGYDKNDDPMDWCECVNSDSECRLNARKGRLRLSLPWLDKAIDPVTGVFAGPDQMERAHRLVQEVFTMLLLNARNGSGVTGGTEPWGHEQSFDPANPEKKFWVPDTEAISIAAASMTANLFDYMDDDSIPTRVRLRSSDFSPIECDRDSDCVNADAGDECLADGFCERNPDAGKPLNIGVDVPRYVYGIEAQPYITEIGTVTAGRGPGEGLIIGFGIELYNPYRRPILLDKYSIVAFDPSSETFNDAWDNPDRRINIVATAGPNAFSVLRAGTSVLLPDLGPGVFDANVPVTFIQEGFRVYLVREWDYDPSEPIARIVVDEFAIEGLQLGVNRQGEPPTNEELRSTERSNVAIDEDMSIPVGPWFAPVPALSLVGKDNLSPGSLGKDVSAGPDGDYGTDDDSTDPSMAMVEAVVGNAGTFARAFPTTGSMLLLMRYANRGATEYAFDGFQPAPLAFTAHLDDVAQVVQGCPGATTEVFMRDEMENGRMPVFDDKGAHRLPACGSGTNEPGDLQRLSWGQLVFDYFTALPLSNLGPYEFAQDTDIPGACCEWDENTGEYVGCFPEREVNCRDSVGVFTVFAGPGTDCPDVACGTLRDQPKVDLDGLRVHGRININAAPWKVLAGLPMMRASAFDFLPAGTQDKMVDTLGLEATAAKPIGEELAMAIVAYRELRELSGVTVGGMTGNYNTTRGWNLDTPSQRRGSGFMSVGELANVDHDGATAGFKIFPGATGPEGKDFVSAASRLIAMGDWMSARSHVFTVYGLLLGDEDLTIEDPDGDDDVTQQLRTEDVLSRAVRFQETVDRLGTFTGDPLPRRIGERVLVGYTDTQND